MENPFLFFEQNFDNELFQKYFGSGIAEPGIYAIPEVSNNPTPAENEIPQDEFQQPEEQFEPQPETNQIQNQNLTVDVDLAAMDKELEPIKKLFLLNKLTELSNLLERKLSINNSSLDLVLKYGTYLSYKTLQVLTINLINQIKEIQNQQNNQSVVVNEPNKYV